MKRRRRFGTESGTAWRAIAGGGRGKIHDPIAIRFPRPVDKRCITAAREQGVGLRSRASPYERGRQLRGPQFRPRRSFLIISRRPSMYSWMIRRASSERAGLGGRSTLPRRGSSGGFMPRRSAQNEKGPLS
jgi:hypothetical protein